MSLFNKIILLIVCAVLCANIALAQDTTKSQEPVTPLFNSPANSVQIKPDSVKTKPTHDPHKATLRSAIIPGWGQAYNREYWKIPIVYGALAIPVSLYFYNNKWYKKTKFAYDALYNATYPNP